MQQLQIVQDQEEAIPPPGTALVESLDRRLLVQLRDGRKIVGTLRSFDQFANLVMEGTLERIIVGDQFCERALGLYVVRGENVVLLGELDERLDPPAALHRVSLEEIKQAQRAEQQQRTIQKTMRERMDFLDMLD